MPATPRRSRHPASQPVAHTVFDRHGRVVLVLYGEYDSASTKLLERQLAAGMRYGADRLLVDLHGVRFIDSAVVWVLQRAADTLDGQSRVLAVTSPSRSVERVLAVCGASDLISTTDVAEARLSFN